MTNIKIKEFNAYNEYLKGKKQDGAVAVIQEYRNKFMDEVKPDVDGVVRKIEEAYDLLMTAKTDYDAIKDGYRKLVDELNAAARVDKVTGRTDAIQSVSNPIDNFDFKGTRNFAAAIHRIVEDYNTAGTSRQKPFNYKSDAKKEIK